MTDNVTLNSGSGGEVVATDDVGGIHYQRVKLTPGAADAAAYAATNYRYRASAATNQDSDTVKASAGILYGLTVTNSNTAARYLRLYNQATDPASTDTANLWRTYVVPGSGGIREQFPFGVSFSTGLAHRMTTGEAENNADAVTAGDLHINLEYV